MKNVIVTGANGFIGTWLVNKLLEENIHVLAVVKDESEDCTSLKNSPLLAIEYCDLDNIFELTNRIEKNKYDTIYHLAWAGTSGPLRADYEMQIKNVKYTLDVINMFSQIGGKKFIGAGTLAEYDNLAYIPLDGATPNAVSMYGAAKISAHYLSKIECNRLGVEHIWGVFSNIYGVGNTTNNFVNFASKLMLKGEKAAFTKGEQNYDFVYITDFIQGLYLLGVSGKNNSEYFIGSGKCRRLKQYIELIRDSIDKNIPLYLGEIPFNGVSLEEKQLSIEKLTKDTGYLPKVSFEDGIERTISWLKSQN